MKQIICLLLVYLFTYNLFAADLTFTAIGDQPYGDSRQFEKLILKINQDNESSFTVHVGDFQSGKTICSDSNFIKIKTIFNTFTNPLIYVPGDNDWTDCHRKKMGRYDPQERLTKLRELFFINSLSLGKSSINVEQQGLLMPQFSEFIENLSWNKNQILFLSFNIPGGNNNIKSIDEFTKRNSANIEWLLSSTKNTNINQFEAIVLAMQADTFISGHDSGYKSFISALITSAKNFKKPILVIQGDTHEFRVDQPFYDESGTAVENVMRLIVPGDGLTEAVQVKIDTSEKQILNIFKFKKYGL